MNIIKTLFLVTVIPVIFTGCGKEEKDCSKISDKQKREECAHKASFSGDHLAPTPNPKKW